MDLNKLGAAVASCENRVVRFPCDSPTYNGAIKRASMWHDAGVAHAEQTTVRVCVCALPAFEPRLFTDNVTERF